MLDIDDKIHKARELADRGATEGERAAARAAVDRLLARKMADHAHEARVKVETPPVPRVVYSAPTPRPVSKPPAKAPVKARKAPTPKAPVTPAGVAYTVLGIVASDSSDATYEIRKGRDGVVYCTCPAWRYQFGVAPKFRSCKHLRKRPDLTRPVEAPATENVYVYQRGR